MKTSLESTTRRIFLKNAGKSVVSAVIAAGASPLLLPAKQSFAGVDTVNFAYILSDHHAPMMVIAQNPVLFEEKFNMYLKPLTDGRLYDFYHEGSSICRVKMVPTKKGPDVEKLMARGSVDMAISGTQAILMSVDRGVDTKIISPVQTAGNVFVLKKNLQVKTWKEFVKHVKGSGRKMKIGIPGPHTVAAIIFRSALDHEGISYTEDAVDKSADIVFINMKGHGNLVAALNNNITQGIIGAQPYPALTIHQGIGKLILNLQDVPPAGRWQGHACCSMEASGRFLKQRPEVSQKLAELLAAGVHLTQEDKELTAKSCSTWLGVDRSVETTAMASLDYTTNPAAEWKQSVYTYAATMDRMSMFNGTLAEKRGKEVDPAAFDFSVMERAQANLKKRGFSV